MWIKPCGHRLVVKPFKQVEVDEVMKKHSEFLKGFEIVNSNKKREDASVDVGTVVDIGPTAWKDFGGTPWCEVGDTVVFAKFAGKFLENPFNDSAEPVFLINDEDVVGVFVKE
jgi:co-chaperonin GroES (HSP10)